MDARVKVLDLNVWCSNPIHVKKAVDANEKKLQTSILYLVILNVIHVIPFSKVERGIAVLCTDKGNVLVDQ